MINRTGGSTVPKVPAWKLRQQMQEYSNLLSTTNETEEVGGTRSDTSRWTDKNETAATNKVPCAMPAWKLREQCKRTRGDYFADGSSSVFSTLCSRNPSSLCSLSSDIESGEVFDDYYSTIVPATTRSTRSAKEVFDDYYSTIEPATTGSTRSTFSFDRAYHIRTMDQANDTDRTDAKKTLGTWIDVFAGCGTVIGRILSFLGEIDVLHLERTSDGVTPHVTTPQWAYLDEIDRSSGTNTKWRQPQEPPSGCSSNEGSTSDTSGNCSSRLRGIEFATNALFAKKCSEEAFWYFAFDRDNVTPEDIPVRRRITLRTTECGTVEHQHEQSMPSRWERWADLDGLVEGNETIAIDVFLDISFHRSNNPSDTLSWRGFRKATFQNHHGLNLKLDLDSLAEETGWKELTHFRDYSQDYAFTHYEVEGSQQMMKSFMQQIQVTLLQASMTTEFPTEDHEPSLLIATGGYSSPSWGKGTHMVFSRNANVGRFHSRNSRRPLTVGFDALNFDTIRSTYLRIPTRNSPDQTLGITLTTA